MQWIRIENPKLTERRRRTEKEACTVMLQQYLQSPPTVTERLAFAWAFQENKESKKMTDSYRVIPVAEGKQSRL